MEHLLEWEEFNSINEIGDGSSKSYKFKKDSESKYEVIYSFKTPSKLNYKVFFNHDGEVSDIDFGVKIKNDISVEAITNKGELFNVMSTLMNIIKEFVTDYPQIETMKFSGQKKSDTEDISQRTKLYMSFLKNNPIDNWSSSQKGNSIEMNKNN